MNELLGMIRSAGVTRLAAIIGATAGAAIALSLIVGRLAEPPLSVLYADLDLRDAQAVVDRLEQEDLRYEMRERDGRVAVLAPSSEIARLKVSLAADGLAPNSGVGWEIFDKQDAFGATSFQQNVNRLRALEGELARTIASIEGVRSARVHLVLPERELFARDRAPATASIVIDAPRGLDRRAVRAIVNLAASAAPELKPQHVTVLDSTGALLASGEEDNAPGVGAEERAVATEMRLRKAVEDIVGPIVGFENLRVQVAADMDFNRVTENAEIIDPDSQTVLSSVTVEEASDERDPAAGRGVTVANALPGAEPVGEQYPQSSATNRRIEETTNYEMSRTVRSEVREQGVVKRLSVAVALAAGAAPRAPEDLARIDALVKSAVGFSAARGDRVEVVEVAFTPAPPSAPAAGATAESASSPQGALRIAEIAALSIIGLGIVVFVLRPLLAGKGPRVAQALGKPAQPTPAELPPPVAALEQKIDLARVDGQVRASSINKVAEVVRGHTDESVGILRNWIRQAS